MAVEPRQTKAKEGRRVAFKAVELTLNPPDPIKLGHLTITFNTGTDISEESIEITAAYNAVIPKVGKKHNLYILPQAGAGGLRPGFYMWEVWTKTDEETLKNLLPEIHKEAEEIFNFYSGSKAGEYWLSQIKQNKP